MAETMIERVAKALEAKVENGFTPYEEAARVAIEAMRKPTPTMVNAWLNEVRPENEGMKFEDVFVQRFWPAAIDAALSEGGE